MDPITIGALIGGGASVLSGIWSAREARKNREFQERMSSSAHQREVADLRLAGLNPILSANRGASSPSGAQGDSPDIGGGVLRGVSTALAVKQQKAQIELLEAQADAARSSGLLTRTQSADIQTTANAGRIESVSTQRDILNLDLHQRQQMLPLVLEQAKAEVSRTLSSARAAEAVAALDELDKNRAMNLAEFEKRFGEATPTLRFLFELMRSLPRTRR